MIHNISIATADDVTYFGDDVKYIPCIFTQGNYHLGMLSQLVRKDDCFRPVVWSICCKLIWELKSRYVWTRLIKDLSHNFELISSDD